MSRKKPPSAPAAAQPQVLADVLRELERSHALALMTEHLAEYAAAAFRGTESRGPTKLLQLPSGLRCRADEADVLELEATLRRMAVDARATLQRLKGASLVVDVAPTRATAAPPPPPDGEAVADNPEVKPAWQTGKLEPDQGEAK